MTENSIKAIHQLQKLVTRVLPLLEKNLWAAHWEALDGFWLARGPYSTCRDRHSVALTLIRMSAHQLSLDGSLGACEMLFIDLRSAMKDLAADEDVEAPERDEAQGKFDALWNFYKEHGYPFVNPLLGIPAKQDTAGPHGDAMAIQAAAVALALRLNADSEGAFKGRGYTGEVRATSLQPLVALAIDGVSEAKALAILAILNNPD